MNQFFTSKRQSVYLKLMGGHILGSNLDLLLRSLTSYLLRHVCTSFKSWNKHVCGLCCVFSFVLHYMVEEKNVQSGKVTFHSNKQGQKYLALVSTWVTETWSYVAPRLWTVYYRFISQKKMEEKSRSYPIHMVMSNM